MKIQVFISVIVLFCSYSSLAIVNIESIRNQNTDKKYATNILLSGSRITGNSNKEAAALSGQFRAQNDDSQHLFLTSANYGESNKVKDVNKSLAHYRYAWNILEPISYEVFLQTEMNEFTKLLLRQLVGAGLRFRLYKNETFFSYLGAGLMYENEHLNIDSVEEVNNNTRANIYLSIKAKICENVQFLNVSYYQPNFEDNEDFKAFSESQIEFKVNEYLLVVLEHSLAFDNQPVPNVEKADHTYKTSFKIAF